MAKKKSNDEAKLAESVDVETASDHDDRSHEIAAHEEMRQALVQESDELQSKLDEAEEYIQELQAKLADAQASSLPADCVVIGGKVYTNIRRESAKIFVEDVYKKRYCDQDHIVVVVYDLRG